MEIKLEPTRDVIVNELKALRKTGVSASSIKYSEERLEGLRQRATRLPGGHILKIVWDAEGGYPEHAWGYTQYTVRPFIQGYGCDGTTDSEIHYIAIRLCEQLNINYLQAYGKAYGPQGLKQARAWLEGLRSKTMPADTVILPESVNEDALRLMLSDLYQINNRSLVDVLQEELADQGFQVSDWYSCEDQLTLQVCQRYGIAA